MPPRKKGIDAKAPATAAEAAKKAEKKPTAKAAKRAPVPVQQTYRVVFRQWDHHNGLEPTEETVARYASYEAAKAKVRAYLLKQWDRDFFEEFTESEEGDESGGFEVYALCPEGEEMWVYVEDEAPLIGGVEGGGVPGTAQQTYRVVFRQADNNNGLDPTEETVGRYASYDAAKAKVRSYLLEQWDRDFFEDFTENEEGEESGGFEVYALCPEGEEMWVYVEEEPAVIGSGEADSESESEGDEGDEDSDAYDDL